MKKNKFVDRMNGWNEFDELERLKERIVNAADVSDRGVILLILGDIKEVILSKKASKWFIYSVLSILMSYMRQSFIGLLTRNEFKRLFVEIFLASPSQYSLSVVLGDIRYLENCEMERAFEFLNALEESAFPSLLEMCFDKSPDDPEWCAFIDEISRSLWHLQDRIYNTIAIKSSDLLVCGRGDLHMAFLESHWERIVDTVKRAVTIANARIENSLDTNMQFIAALLPPLFRGCIKRFRDLILWLGTRDDTPIGERLNARLLSETIISGFLPGREAIVEIVLAVVDGRMLKRLLSNEIVRDPIKKFLFDDMLFVKVFAAEEMVPLKLVQCLNAGYSSISSSEGRESWIKVHIDAAIRLLKVWSQKSHLLLSSDQQLDYIDCALLCFFKYASEDCLKRMKWLAEEALIDGVQRHLECSDPRRKIRGLYITEKLSEWLSFPDLHFDQISELNEELNDLRIIANGELEQLRKQMSENQEKDCRRIGEGISLKSMIATREKIELDSDDDDFPQYSIPEEEFHLKEANEGDILEKREPPPNYIRDCMVALYENESCAKFEAAFDVLNQFIRKRALGYEDIVEELIMRLVFLEDRFNTKNFTDRRSEMIVSCMVMSAHLAPMLIDLMYSRRCAMCNRYLILNALAKAASELSTPARKVVDESASATLGLTSEGSSKSWREVIDERVEKKTRRFGRGVSNKITPQKNRFAEFASGFLRPLLAINQHREHLDLQNRDSALLAKILSTCAHIMQCAQNCPNAPRLATWLELCVKELRSHEDSCVRLSVLCCYESICRALPDEVFFALFAESIPEWMAYTTFQAKNDPSEICSGLALNIQRLILSKVPSPLQQLR
uniref:Telomere length regulation protein conserved domain-containing protein n=4 Tax=Parascaris univalens TaxID=6257 RepID=A0A915AH90_PARUN